MQNKSQQNPVSKEDMELLLKEQTAAILEAVDDRLGKFEMRFNRKLDQLTTTLDKFLKRLTDFEDEFVILKKDVNHIKTVLKEKLGVNLL